MQASELEGTIQEYMKAFEARDLARCLEFYSENATISFQDAIYRGRQAMEEWHNERFLADLKILDIDYVRAEDNEVIVDVVVSSNTLKEWNINRLNGTIAFHFQQGRIDEATFELRAHNPELWQV